MYTLHSGRFDFTLSGSIFGRIEGGSSTPGPSNPQPGSDNIFPVNSDSYEEEDNVNIPVVNIPVVNTQRDTTVGNRVFSTTKNLITNRMAPVCLLQERHDIKFKTVAGLNLFVLLPIQGNIPLDNSSDYYVLKRSISPHSDQLTAPLFRSLSQYRPVYVETRGAKLGFYHKFLSNHQISTISPFYSSSNYHGQNMELYASPNFPDRLSITAYRISNIGRVEYTPGYVLSCPRDINETTLVGFYLKHRELLDSKCILLPK